jgi:hypothetical protein
VEIFTCPSRLFSSLPGALRHPLASHSPCPFLYSDPLPLYTQCKGANRELGWGKGPFRAICQQRERKTGHLSPGAVRTGSQGDLQVPYF